MKKLAGSVRFGFGFISKKPNRTQTKKTRKNQAKPGKTEPNRKKPSQNRENRAKPVWTGFCPEKPNRTETGRFEPVSVFFKKKIIQFGYFFLIKTESNRKWSPLLPMYSSPLATLLKGILTFLLCHVMVWLYMASASVMLNVWCKGSKPFSVLTVGQDRNSIIILLSYQYHTQIYFPAY